MILYASTKAFKAASFILDLQSEEQPQQEQSNIASLQD